MSRPNIPGRGRGRPAFTPSAQQRHIVSSLAGSRMNHSSLAKLIVNPSTNEPINEETLRKAFPLELAAGRARLESLIMSKFYEHLNAGSWAAIAFGLRHVLGYKDDLAVDLTAGGGDIQVSLNFVRPDPQLIEHDDYQPPRQINGHVNGHSKNGNGNGGNGHT